MTIARAQLAASGATTYTTHTTDRPVTTTTIDTSFTVVRGLVELLLQDLPCDPQGLGASVMDALIRLENEIATVVRHELHKKTLLSA